LVSPLAVISIGCFSVPACPNAEAQAQNNPKIVKTSLRIAGCEATERAPPCKGKRAAARRASLPLFDIGHWAFDASAARTEQEETDKADRLASIQNAQTRAKEKYGQSATAKLKQYWIGEKLTSRSKIEQAGAGIWALLRTTDDSNNPIAPQDTLPGFDQAAIDLLKTRFDAYKGIQTAQTFAQGTASGARMSLKDQCEQVSRRRRKLQLAIDAEYPPGAANSAFRKQFGLQGNKAMS
jgi:hypothetical protein